jgi:hypothetical protein
MEYKYIGKLKEGLLVYSANKNYYVGSEYNNLRKVTNKEARKLKAKYGPLEKKIKNKREVRDIQYYIDKGYKR